MTDDADVRAEGRYAIACVVNLAHSLALAGRAITIDVDVQDSDATPAKVRVTLGVDPPRAETPP